MCNKSLAKVVETLSVPTAYSCVMTKRTLTAGAVKKLLPFIGNILPLNSILVKWIASIYVKSYGIISVFYKLV